MSSTKNWLHRLFKIDAAEHGRTEEVKANDEVNLQVINFGLSRTGTTSFSAALEILGYGPCHQGIDTFRSATLREGWITILKDINNHRATPGPALSSRIRHMMRGYRSACDHPIDTIPEEVLDAYSNAKYVLSVRSGGAAAWYKSFDGAVGIHFRNDWSTHLFHFLLFPVGFLRRLNVQVEQHRLTRVRQYGAIDVAMYDKHTEYVQGLVKGKGKELLLYDVKDGWEPLCRFLGREVPDVPFPKLNEQQNMRAIYVGMQVFGACVWAVYLSVFGGAVFLATRPGIVMGVLVGAGEWFGKLRLRLT